MRDTGKEAANLSQLEITEEQYICELFDTCPIPKEELLRNLGVFMRRRDLQRVLFMNELYQKIIDVHGIVVEFGVRWGQNLALFESFRGMYEPYNHIRKIVGFDTFEGFPSVHEKDGSAGFVEKGGYTVTKDYEKYLEELLLFHERQSPIGHIKKFQLVKGDAIVELEKYLDKNPETIIALAYFDFDIYEPTKKCLDLIKPHITKGTVIGFDELNCHGFPGETLAVKEAIGLGTYKIERNIYSSCQSYLTIT
jgi:hypothetical protein